MSQVIEKAVLALSGKIAKGYEGVAKFVVQGEGAIIIDSQGVREGDDDADVTLTASADVFEAIFRGEMGATGAYMSGKLQIDGSLPMAMKLAAVLV